MRCAEALRLQSASPQSATRQTASADDDCLVVVTTVLSRFSLLNFVFDWSFQTIRELSPYQLITHLHGKQTAKAYAHNQ